ncbi:MAG: L-threonylcarbamoyladenylate synthase [Planctomycetota bacterium]
MSAGRADILAAAERLGQGGLVAFPTETVYGLGADTLSEEAVARVFEAKGRPKANPLIVHVSSEAMAGRVVAAWSAEAQKLAKAFWPGPLTIVLPRSERVPSIVTAGADTVAVRCPDHEVAFTLIESFGGPLVGPSANRSGGVSPTRAEHVRGVWPENEVMVLDGGPCRAGIESTVISLVGDPVVLRPGVVGVDTLEVALGADIAIDHGDGSRGSPGRVGPHYRPTAPVYLVDDLADVDTLGEPCVVLSPPGTPVTVQPPNAVIQMPAAAADYAAELYAALREADAFGPASIAVCRPPETGGDSTDAAIWLAIRERLGRAAEEG